MPRADECPGVGKGRFEAGGPFTLIDGTDGVTEMEGGCTLDFGTDGSLMEMVGTLGVTDIDGAFIFDLLSAGLTEIVGVSWTEMVGMEYAGDDLDRIVPGGLILRVGIGGATDDELFAVLDVRGSGLDGGSS